MILLLAGVLWLTIAGANYPSAMLFWLLLDTFQPALKTGSAAMGMPWWLSGILIDGVYLSTAWVVSVMLPPMAIFFPLFTLLEDFGYLPRVAFNLDGLFRRAGAHGKQALTMWDFFGWSGVRFGWLQAISDFLAVFVISTSARRACCRPGWGKVVRPSRLRAWRWTWRWGREPWERPGRWGASCPRWAWVA